jgi:hypothetical protein
MTDARLGLQRTEGSKYLQSKAVTHALQEDAVHDDTNSSCQL